jgi:CHAT domain-containing protein
MLQCFFWSPLTRFSGYFDDFSINVAAATRLCSSKLSYSLHYHIILVQSYILLPFAFLILYCEASAQPDATSYLALSERLHQVLLKRPVRGAQQQFAQHGYVAEVFDSLFQRLEAYPTDTVLLGSMYNNVLLLHNASVDEDVVLRQKINYTDPETLRLFAQRNQLLALLGREYEKPIARRQLVGQRLAEVNSLELTLLNRLRKGKDHFNALSIEAARVLYERDKSSKAYLCYQQIRNKGGEPAMAEAIYRYSRTRTVNSLRWEIIRDNLSSREVAIEFVTYHVWDVDKRFRTLKYGALLLRKGAVTPTFVPLCTQNALGQLFRTDQLDDVYLQYLYAPPADSETSLYELIWAPLLPAIGTAKRVYYAPAGELHRINLGAVARSEAEVPLHRQYEFVLINSARSLINPSYQTQRIQPIKLPCIVKSELKITDIDNLLGNTAFDYYGAVTTRSAVLMGSVMYDMDSAAIKQNLLVPMPLVKPDSVAIKKKKRERIGGENWEILHGTRFEVEKINNLLLQAKYEVTILQGHQASEENFKQLGLNGASPRVLHIATHGFFLADSELDTIENPLNRSGLILAGANHAWQSGWPKQGMEDGILTAFEISQVNLQNTELVVLSACETGLGYVQNNEGVWGLQRAFKRAGVRNLLVSLWSVPDEATQLLMTRFYQNCLASNMPMRLALSDAQQWLSSQEGYSNPYYWAGFVLME